MANRLDTAQTLKAKLEKLNSDLQLVKRDYDTVARDLKANVSTGAMADRWQGLAKTFSALSWEVKDNATGISTSLEQLATIVLPLVAGEMGGIPLSEIQNTLQEYRSIQSTSEANIGELTNKFTSLLESTKSFGNDLGGAGDESLRTLKDLEKTIRHKGRNVDNCRSQIDGLLLQAPKQGTEAQGHGWWSSYGGSNQTSSRSRQTEHERWMSDVNAKISEWGSLKVELGVLDEDRKRLQIRQDIYNMATKIVDNTLKATIPQLSIFQDVSKSIDKDIEQLRKYVENPGQGIVPAALAAHQAGSYKRDIRRALKDFAIASASANIGLL